VNAGETTSEQARIRHVVLTKLRAVPDIMGLDAFG
jgi:hypothetical protein